MPGNKSQYCWTMINSPSFYPGVAGNVFVYNTRILSYSIDNPSPECEAN